MCVSLTDEDILKSIVKTTEVGVYWKRWPTISPNHRHVFTYYNLIGHFYPPNKVQTQALVSFNVSHTNHKSGNNCNTWARKIITEELCQCTYLTVHKTTATFVFTCWTNVALLHRVSNTGSVTQHHQRTNALRVNETVNKHFDTYSFGNQFLYETKPIRSSKADLQLCNQKPSRA